MHPADHVDINLGKLKAKERFLKTNPIYTYFAAFTINY